MDLDGYISQLRKLKELIPTAVIVTFYDNEPFIVREVQKRLEGTGVDGAGKKLGDYKDSTKAIKRGKNQKFNFVTLKDSENFYNAMEITDDGKNIFIDSRDWKTSILESVWGPNILALNNIETEVFILRKVDPVIQKEIDKLPNIEL